jgi:thioredoxin-related protein
MLSRRQFHRVSLGALGLLAGTRPAVSAPTRYEPELLENGQYTQSWFLSSFLELADDLAAATEGGKRLAILWEQEGCPYCREMHTVNFAIPEIRDYVEANFEIVQLDIWGAREVVDFNGEAMEERALARRNGARYTPTIQFFPERLEEMAGASGKAAEVARMPGYFRPFHFLTMFQYVRDKAYGEQSFKAYLRNTVAALKAEGKGLPSW